MRTVTRLQLRDRAKHLANIQNDPNFDDDEVNDLINLHMPAVYDILVAAGPADYYAAEDTVDVVAGQIQYQLPEDFLSLVNVFVHESDEWRRPIDIMRDRQRQSYRAPIQSCTITLEYIPTCPVMDEDSDTFDGVDGWEELVSARVARDLLTKREGDPGVVLATIAQAEKRIRSASTSRVRGGPKLVQDLESDLGWWHSVRVDVYRVRAGNIEFYSNIWWPFV